jgi:hypothetical protein
MAFRIFSYLSLFLLVFDLAIPGIGRIGSAPLSAVISIVWILTRGANEVGVIKTSKGLVFVYAAIFFQVALRLLFSLGEEMSFFFSSAKSLVILISALLYVKAFLCKDTGRQIVNIFVLNAVICLVAGTYTPLLDIVYKFKAGGDLDPGFIPYRNAFLSGSGYYGIGAPYAVVFLLSMVLLLNFSGKKNLFEYFKIMLIAIAGMLAARTMFVGIAFGFAYVLWRRPLFTVPAIALLAVAIVVLLSFDQTAQYSDWMFEMFINDSSSGSGSQSTDHLMTMYFVPEPMTLLFGDGRYSEGDLYYMETDAGYMRHMLFGGLPIMLSVLLIPVVLAKISRSIAFGLFIVPLVYILHVKGNFIYNSPAGMPLLILIAFWMRFYFDQGTQKIASWRHAVKVAPLHTQP